MGIKTKQFAFGAIDSKSSPRDKSKLTEETEEDFKYQSKIFQLDHYHMSFATIGTVLLSDEGQRVGFNLKLEIDQKPKKASYDKIIGEIANTYKDAYVQQIKDDSKSTVVIFGYDSVKETPFMYKCVSPNFEPEEISSNELIFAGSYHEDYKDAAKEIFDENYSGNSEVNLYHWATDIFENLSQNELVGYPYYLHLYKKGLSLGNPSPFTGDTIKENEHKFDTRFKVDLPYIK